MRTAGAVLCGVGALLLVIGLISRAWWSGSVSGLERIEISTREVRGCAFDRCATVSTERLGAEGLDDGSFIFGKVAFFAGVGAALFLLLSTALSWNREGTIIAVWIAVPMAAIALGASMTFLVRLNDHASAIGLSLGIPGPAAVLGGLCGVVGGVALLWPASDGQYTASDGQQAGATIRAASAASGSVLACPTCSAPAAWKSEHRRFFCPTCRVYL